MIKNFTAIIFVFTALFAQAQCFLQQIPLPERVQNAAIIVEAKVGSQYCFEDTESGHIYTVNRLEVLRIFKGQNLVTNATVDLFTFGGQVGDRMEMATPSLQLQKGELGIFMLGQNKSFIALKAHNYKQSEVEGYFGISGPSSYISVDILTQKAHDEFETFAHYSEAIADVEDILGVESQVISSFKFPKISANKKAGISSFSPDTITAGNGALLTIEGSGFGADYGSVAFANADDGGASNSIFSDSVYFISWSDTKIEIIVPQSAGTGKIQVISADNVSNTSSSNLTVTYARLNIIAEGPTTNPGRRLYSPSLEDDNGLGGYVWRINTDFKKEHGAVKAIMRAMQSWRCSTGLNFNIDTTTATTVNKVDRDGVHCIMWQNPNQSISTGALAVTYSLWSGCYNASSKDWHWFLNDVDMVFDDELSSGKTWNYGPGTPTWAQYDLESVALHELGHAHQLGHIIDASGVMHYSIKNGESKRVLNPKVDVVGGNDVMKSSTVTSGCSQITPMVAVNTNCKLIDVVDVMASFTVSSTKVCVGDTVTMSNTSEPINSDLTWRIPANVLLVSGTINDEKITVVVNASGKLSLGLLVENTGFSDSFYVDIISSKIPKPLSKLDNVSCFGKSDGKATFILGEGTAPFSIKWFDNNKNQNPRTELAPDTYYFLCQDATGCSMTSEITITEPDSFYASSGFESTWGGLARGKAFVSAVGGTPPYKVRWDDDAAQKTDTAIRLKQGVYTATITDAHDCTIIIKVNVDEHASVADELQRYFYPNPTTGQINFNNINSFSTLIITDFSGKKLFDFKLTNGNNTMNIQHLPNATYFVQITGNEQVVRFVLLKI